MMTKREAQDEINRMWEAIDRMSKNDPDRQGLIDYANSEEQRLLKI